MVDAGIDATLNANPVSFGRFGTYNAWINLENPCDVTRLIDECKVRIDLDVGASDCVVQFRGYKKVGADLVQTSASAWETLTAIGDYVRTFTTSFVLGEGEYLGCVTYDPHAGAPPLSGDITVIMANPSYGYDAHIHLGGDVDVYGVISDYDDYDFNYGILMGCTGDITGSGSGIGGDPRNACQLVTDVISIDEDTSATDLWGWFYLNDISVGVDKAYVDMTFPWDTTGVEQTDEVFNDGVTRTFDNPLDDSEHYSLKIEVFSSTSVYNIYECWWKEDPNGNIYVDEHTGDDSNFGVSWEYPYATLTKGMEEVGTNAVVNITGGTYASESSPEPNRDCYMKIRDPLYWDITEMTTSEDTFTAKSVPDTNYGNLTFVTSSEGAPGTNLQYSYVQFDISDISATDDIHDVNLRVYMAGGSGGSLMQIESLSESFNEDNVTWNNSPSVDSQWSTSFIPSTFIGYIDISIDSSYVEDSLSSGYFGLRFITDDYGSYSFRTKEWTTVSQRPLLTIRHSPSYATSDVIVSK